MENETNDLNAIWQEELRRKKRGKIMTGIIVVVIGALYLSRELGANIPEWLFTWKTLLIGFGVIVIAKHKFQSFQGLLFILVGGAFLVSDLMPELALKPLLWPILVIVLGLIIIFKPHNRHSFHSYYSRKYRRNYHKNYHNAAHWQGMEEEVINDDRIDVVTLMGGVKKNVVSKSFKGGSIRNTMGGSEINLSQADFEGTVVLDISTTLGGTELIIPANWTLQSEVVAVMGSIEDQRKYQGNTTYDPNKILILRGNVFMGGIEIRSY